MVYQLSPDTKTMLQRYIDGLISNAELEEWLAETEHDTAVPASERDLLAAARLAVIEVSEEVRQPDDILRTVASILATADPEKPIIAYRTTSATASQQEVRGSATPSQVRHAGIGISV